MKKAKATFLSILILFSSCKSAVILTHQEAMNRINTKQQVINKFGLPSNKSADGDLEQWIYDYGTVNRTSTYVSPVTTTGTATYNQYNNSVNVNATTYGGTGFTSTSSYKKYAKFLLRGERVIRWESVGINEQVIDKKIRRNNIWIASGVIVGALIGWLIAEEKALNQDEYDYWND